MLASLVAVFACERITNKHAQSQYDGSDLHSSPESDKERNNSCQQSQHRDNACCVQQIT